MRVWTVHADRAAGSPAAAATLPRPPVLVPERFSFLAFLFNLAWLLWHRLWLAALAYLGLALALGLLLPPGPGVLAALGLQFLLGAHAHDLRRRALARRGYAQIGLVAARDEDAALARLIDRRPELAAPLAGLGTAPVGAAPVGVAPA